MRWVTLEQGNLHIDKIVAAIAPGNHTLTLNEYHESPSSWIRPALARPGVHELLYSMQDGLPVSPAAWCLGPVVTARQSSDTIPNIIWCDPDADLYPPALWGLFHATSIRIHLLRVSHKNLLAGACECLRSPGVTAVVAPVPTRLNRVQARRLQLACESAGTTAILIRHTGRGDDIYAASTRWRITPAPGTRHKQRWIMQLLHGHGRHSEESHLLELDRAAEPLFSIRPYTPQSTAQPQPHLYLPAGVVHHTPHATPRAMSHPSIRLSG